MKHWKIVLYFSMVNADTLLICLFILLYSIHFINCLAINLNFPFKFKGMRFMKYILNRINSTMLSYFMNGNHGIINYICIYISVSLGMHYSEVCHELQSEI